MSVERLRAMLSETTPGKWIVVEPESADTTWRLYVESDDGELRSSIPATLADDRLVALAPDAIALLADLAEALRQIGNAYGCYAGCTAALPGVSPRLHMPGCSAARDALKRLDALCGDDHA